MDDLEMLLGDAVIEEAALTAPHLHEVGVNKGELRTAQFEGSMADPVRFTAGRLVSATVLNMWSTGRGDPIGALMRDVARGRKPPAWAYRLQDLVRGPAGRKRTLCGDGLADLDCAAFKMIEGRLAGGRITAKFKDANWNFRPLKKATGENEYVLTPEVAGTRVAGAVLKILVRGAWDGRELAGGLAAEGDRLILRRTA